MLITRWRNLLDPHGTEERIRWDDLCSEFSRIVRFQGDKEHPGWSPAAFDGQRRAKDAVQRVFAVCLDYDAGETIESATELWSGLRGLLHTTRKHTDEAPRFRVILPLKRSVSPFEFGELWERVNVHAGGKLDPAPKDPSRFWFCPGVGSHPGASFQSVRFDGEPLDPDEWLAKPLPAPKPLGIDYRNHDDADAVERRAIAYLAKMPAAISGSGGHQATWEAALYLAKGFGLSEERTYRILASEYNPRCSPPWTEKELRHKARQAASANAPDGFKLDTDRDWKPRGTYPRAPINDDPVDWNAHYAAQSEPVENDTGEVPPAEDPQTPHEKRSAVDRYGVLSIRDLIDLSIKRIEAGKQETGVRTGYTELDKAIGGFRRGNVTILGGKPSFGKTSWTIALTNAACDDGEPVLVIGAEDVARMYGDRFLALRAKLNATAIRDLDLNDTEKAEAYRALGSAPTVPTFLPARGKTSREVAKAIRDIVSETGAKLVVVDFLQRIRSARRAQDRRNEVTMVCEEITDAIKESDAAGLVISAFKRTEHPRPELEDLKESGDLEYMAEHILLGWKRETRTTGKDRADVERVLLVAKNKDGVDPAYLDEIVMPFDRITGAFRKVPAGARYTRETPPEEADIWDGLDNQSRAAGDYQEDHGL